MKAKQVVIIIRLVHFWIKVSPTHQQFPLHITLNWTFQKPIDAQQRNKKVHTYMLVQWHVKLMATPNNHITSQFLKSSYLKLDKKTVVSSCSSVTISNWQAYCFSLGKAKRPKTAGFQPNPNLMEWVLLKNWGRYGI